MNLRISEGQIRFRVTRDEVSVLFERGALELSLPLVSRICRYRVELGASPAPLTLHEEDALLCLVVDRPTLEAFTAQLPSRDGIEHTIRIKDSELLLVFEVDAKRSPKH